MVRALIASFGLATLLGLGSPLPAAASCAAPQSMADQINSAALVFVGSVVYTSDRDRVAHVQVETIWKGPRQAAYVDVHGSPVSGPFTATSIDRQYQAGVRYLFVLYSAQEPLQDNSCSGTQPYSAELAAYAPGGTQGPLAATFFEKIQNFVVLHIWPLIGVLVVVIAVVVVAWMQLRRRSPNAVR